MKIFEAMAIAEKMEAKGWALCEWVADTSSVMVILRHEATRSRIKFDGDHWSFYSRLVSVDCGTDNLPDLLALVQAEVDRKVAEYNVIKEIL